MNTTQTEFLQGKRIEILEIVLRNTDNQLELSWMVNLDSVTFRMTFFNVSRFSMENLSSPLEVEGLEIINHSQNGWEAESRFELRDFEENRVHFFCESFEVES